MTEVIVTIKNNIGSTSVIVNLGAEVGAGISKVQKLSYYTGLEGLNNFVQDCIQLGFKLPILNDLYDWAELSQKLAFKVTLKINVKKQKI